jgi:hypothetical protein
LLTILDDIPHYEFGLFPSEDWLCTELSPFIPLLQLADRCIRLYNFCVGDVFCGKNESRSASYSSKQCYSGILLVADAWVSRMVSMQQVASAS